MSGKNMKKISKLFLITVLSALFLVGCGKKDEAQSASQIAIGKKLENITLKDQFDKTHTITNETKKVIFVFQKGTGHLVKAYLNTKPTDYMQKKAIGFIADVSPMPGFIRDYVAMPDLRKHNYPVMLITDKEVAKHFKDETNEEVITVVTLDSLVITDIKKLTTEAELQKAID